MLTFGGSGPPAEETSLGHPPRVGAPNIFVCFFFVFVHFLFRLPITMPKLFLLFLSMHETTWRSAPLEPVFKRRSGA